MQTFEERSVRLTDGRNMSYLIFGDAAKCKVVLFFHGFGSSAAAIHPDTSILDELGLCCIGVNRPGYGGSTPLPQYSASRFAHDVVQLLDDLKIDQAAVVGWSAGGLYGQVFAAEYPKRVSSLSLVSSAIPLYSKDTGSVLPGNWRMIRFLNRYLPRLSKRFFRKLSSQVSQNPESVMDKSIRNMVESDRLIAARNPFRQALMKGAVEAYQHDGLPVYADAAALCRAIDLDEAGSFSRKISIWQGEKDSVWTLKTSAYLANKYFTNSKLYVIKESGHLLYLTHWKEILTNL